MKIKFLFLALMMLLFVGCQTVESLENGDTAQIANAISSDAENVSAADYFFGDVSLINSDNVGDWIAAAVFLLALFFVVGGFAWWFGIFDKTPTRRVRQH